MRCLVRVCVCVCVCVQAGYPCRGCQSTCGIYSDASGSLSDGSEAAYYPNFADCKWMIAPTGATAVTITFMEVITEYEYDFVTVSECNDVNCSNPRQLWNFSGSSGSAQSFTSLSGFLMVEFTTDGSVTYQGFTASWTSTDVRNAVACAVLQRRSLCCVAAP